MKTIVNMLIFLIPLALLAVVIAGLSQALAANIDLSENDLISETVKAVKITRQVSLEKKLDNFCADTWCEGEYNLEDIHITRPSHSTVSRIELIHSEWGTQKLRRDICLFDFTKNTFYQFIEKCITAKGI